MRYFIHLAYDGTRYRGWQRQLNTPDSIQEIIETTLSRMTGRQMTVTGCGRTDAGVHARQYFAHIDYPGFDFDPVERLNRMLPDDISVFDFIPVHDRAHTRYDAVQRSYEYHLHFFKDPFLSLYSTHMVTNPPDPLIIREGLDFLMSMRDFRYMCLTPNRAKHTICPLDAATCEFSDDGLRMKFRFTAARFLKSMIRIIVARLLELGSGKITMATFEDINTGHGRLKYSTITYPQGLHLVSVRYPYLDIPVRSALLPGNPSVSR